MGHKYQEQQSVKRGSKYLDLFIQSTCAPDLLMHRLFPNSKEITESYAMFEATTHLPEGFEWNNSDVTVVVVGDGIRPRTAAMFAYRTKWNCVSIDPDMRPHCYDIQRLSVMRKKVEDVSIEVDHNLLIVLPHSHAPLESCLSNLRGKNRCVVAMPCCTPMTIARTPDHVYVDEQVWSPKNEIRIWNKI